MKFIYTGEAPNGWITQYDHQFVPNEPTDVTDPAAIELFKAHKFFYAVSEPEVEAPKNKGGRPKKVVSDVTEAQPNEAETDGDADSA